MLTEKDTFLEWGGLLELRFSEQRLLYSVRIVKPPQAMGFVILGSKNKTDLT